MPKDAAMSPVTFERIPEGVVKEEGIERRRKGGGRDEDENCYESRVPAKGESRNRITVRK